MKMEKENRQKIKFDINSLIINQVSKLKEKIDKRFMH